MFSNSAYFRKEARALWQYHRTTNMLSLASIVIIFMLVGVMLVGYIVSQNVVSTMMEEGNMKVFLLEGAGDQQLDQVNARILDIQGVVSSEVIHKDEAQERMAKVLGEDKDVLTLFDENPFEAFIDVTMNIEASDYIASEIEAMPDVSRVVNHQEVLDQIRGISSVVMTLGIIFLVGILVASAILIGHMIRQGIYLHKEQIETLKLLGAPNHFIHTPFYMIGLWMTILGAVVAGIILTLILVIAYPILTGALVFMPLPSLKQLLAGLWLILPLLGILLGWVGGYTGLSSSKEVKELSIESTKELID